MSGGRVPSPRLARALLSLCLPADEREFVIGDLEETFAIRLAAGDGPGSARRWYWRAALTNIASFRRLERSGRPGTADANRQGDSVMTTLLRDVRYGVRMLVRRPGFTIVGVLTLALGIGANTAMFTVTQALLLKPLPYERPDELVVVNENNLGRGWSSFSVAPGNFLDWRQQTRSFAELAAWNGRTFNFSGGGTPERLRGLAGSAGFFDMLGGTPAVGRGFRPEEFEPGHFVVVLNHAFWTRAFGGRTDVLDRPITLNGQAYTVVGVMHSGWRFGGRDIAVFTPRAFTAADREARGGHFLNVIGRLKPGATIDEARTELAGLASRLEGQYPSTNKGWGTVVVSLHDAAVGRVRPILLILAGAVGLVLLVACANIANMHLARATVRSREMAIRTAIGAGRGRIVMQLLVESLLLAAIGGALGLALASWATAAFVKAYPTLLPRSGDIGLDVSVLAFTAGLTVITAVLFGLAPAISAARPQMSEALKEGGRSGSGPLRRWLRGALVVSEVALALILLVGAGTLLRSFAQLTRVEPGFRIDNRLSLRTLLPQPKYASDARFIGFYDEALDRMRAIPGVESVALTSTVPISGYDEIYSIVVEGRPPLPPGQGFSALYYIVNPDYFATLGIPLLKGRTFTGEDRNGSVRVAIVNDEFVRLHFPAEEPVGKRIRMGRNSDIVREIVGVVGSVKHYALEDKPQAQMYEPFLQMPSPVMSFVLKTTVEPTSVAAAARQAIQQVDPDQPVAETAALSRLVTDSLALPRVQTVLLAAFAAIALLLAVVGLYGVMAYVVSLRTQEIGVRMALGAGPGAVLRMVLAQASMLTGTGLVVGLAGAVALGRALASVLEPLLFQVKPLDPVTLTIVPGVLAAAALLATLIPARRATKVDPIEALRQA